MDDERVRLPVAGTNSFLLFLFKSIILKLTHRFGLNSISYYPIHINTSERNRGMDIHQLKQRIDASGKKLVTLGNEYIKSKDEIAARKVLVKMFGEISQQTLLLGEQNAQMDRNQRGVK